MNCTRGIVLCPGDREQRGRGMGIETNYGMIE